MADDNKIEDFSSKVGQSSLTLIFSVITIIVVIGAAVFFSLQKSAVEGQNEKLFTEIVSLQSEIQLLESQKVEAARTAQQFLASIEEGEIRWSRVISRIQSLIPFDGTTSQAKVDFLSYNGTSNGKINLNAQTRSTKKDPLVDVSEVISAFNESSFFNNAIVPSVTLGENDKGDKTASFIFNIDYKESSPEDIDVSLTGDEAEAASTAGVSR